MRKRWIPSAADFARADAADAFRNRGLSEACERVHKQFEAQGLHKIFLFYSPASDRFGAYLFYRRTQDIADAEKSGLTVQIREAVLFELARAGRGQGEAIAIDFEVDSHENVARDYRGDYFERLR